MYPLTVTQLIRLINGRNPNRSADSAFVDGGEPVTGGEIDSRRVRPGYVFFALPGANTHGIEFARSVSAAGASCIVFDNTVPTEQRDRLRQDEQVRIPLIEVDDCRAALWSLAEWNRAQSAAVLVAVTGSVGKTTTRQLIFRVLSSGFEGIESPASFNNDLGVPLTLLLLQPKHEFGVLELGASAPGEIRRLARLVRPEVSVVTRVAEAHLEGFGDLSGVQQAKQELAEETQSSGIVFLNADDERVVAMKSSTSARVLTFGSREDCTFRFCSVRQNSAGTTISIDHQDYLTPGTYRHLSGNAAAAISVGLTLGLTPDQIQTGLNQFEIPRGRGNVVAGLPWTVIDDSYNASPASVIAAAEALVEHPTAGRRILVLGDMLELGPQSTLIHTELGNRISQYPIDHVLIFGTFAEHLANGFKDGLHQRSRNRNCTEATEPLPILPIDQRSFANHVSVFSDISTLSVMLDCLASPGDVIWVKGSRGSAMERVVKHLVELAGSSPIPRQAA